MKKANVLKLVMAAAVFVTLVSIGGCIPQVSHEKDVEFSESFAPGGKFDLETHNGKIKITGSDSDGCQIKAKITARAETEEKAQELAEKVKIDIKNSGNSLVIRVDKPRNLRNQSVSVSFDVVLPIETALALKTHNGGVEVTNINGDTKAKTHNGHISLTNVNGHGDIETHNGGIKCSDISGTSRMKTHNGSVTANYTAATTTPGSADIETHNGSVNLTYADNAAAGDEIKLKTHNGNIKLDTPEGFSAQIEASTHNGKIMSELAITVVGEISKNNLTGRIGDGKGKLYLKTHNGSINIK